MLAQDKSLTADQMVRAQRVVNVKTALNGVSGCMKVTPFLVAPNADCLVKMLEQFRLDIKAASRLLKVNAKQEPVVGVKVDMPKVEAIAADFLAQGSNDLVRTRFSHAVKAINVTLDGMKSSARKRGVIECDAADKAWDQMQDLAVVTAAAEIFYRQAPEQVRNGYYGVSF